MGVVLEAREIKLDQDVVTVFLPDGIYLTNDERPHSICASTWLLRASILLSALSTILLSHRTPAGTIGNSPLAFETLN